MASMTKILIVGRGEAGKSTLVSRLSEGALNLAHRGRTVAMDHGVFRLRGIAFSLVGVPGQARFAAVREALAQGARGALWVHPAGEDPDAETTALLRNAALAACPYAVFVNHRAEHPAVCGFVPPPDLRPPVAVAEGDLLAPPERLAPLLETLVTLAEAG